MIWLIGSGAMSVDYSKVLDAQNKDYLVIGRGLESAEDFQTKTGRKVITGGLYDYLNSKPLVAESAIVCVGVAQLYETTLCLINAGVKNILVEKPGGITVEEVKTLEQQAARTSSSVYIAYNRRFFSSVLTAIEKIKGEGGVTSFNFELTEWGHVIEKLDKPKEVLKKWFLANSTHVADLAFFLGGKPKEMASFTQGNLCWHPSGSIFSGAGISTEGALFSYNANWESAGRWSVEVLTKENRYIFRPMEQLQVQKRGTIPIVNVDIDDTLDIKYKPGLYKQVEAFLSSNKELLCSVNEQLDMFQYYESMAGYTS
ncbi:Gfo/Idh/MocA family oxidoreductase [Vibrio sp. TRT 21S02]|uniref:Gfo/Idh/MocA family oxidoreductase n=1 Tax=Vibrio sp. TRT 21S02 TaxID=3418507 RepID=UPI003CF3E9F2